MTYSGWNGGRVTYKWIYNPMDLYVSLDPGEDRHRVGFWASSKDMVLGSKVRSLVPILMSNCHHLDGLNNTGNGQNSPLRTSRTFQEKRILG